MIRKRITAANEERGVIKFQRVLSVGQLQPKQATAHKISSQHTKQQNIIKQVAQLLL